MKKFVYRVALLTFVPLALVGCGKPGNTPQGETPSSQIEKLDVASGSKEGNYYQAAQELNDIAQEAGFPLDIKESSGSVENLKNVGEGNAQLAFAQLDAIVLLRDFGDDSTKELANKVKILAPINNEVIHIIVNKSSDIENLDDLKGKKVSVGPKESGTAVSALAIYQFHEALDIEEEEDNGNLVYMPIDESIEKVAEGEIDAAFYTSLKGTPLLQEISATDGQNMEILSIEPSFLKQYVNWYIPEDIPANTYPWQQEDVSTISTSSVLIVNQSVETEKVYELTKLIYSKASDLKEKNSFWNALNPKNAQQYIDSELEYHPGVLNFLEE